MTPRLVPPFGGNAKRLAHPARCGCGGFVSPPKVPHSHTPSGWSTRKQAAAHINLIEIIYYTRHLGQRRRQAPSKSHRLTPRVRAATAPRRHGLGPRRSLSAAGTTVWCGVVGEDHLADGPLLQRPATAPPRPPCPRGRREAEGWRRGQPAVRVAAGVLRGWPQALRPAAPSDAEDFKSPRPRQDEAASLDALEARRVDPLSTGLRARRALVRGEGMKMTTSRGIRCRWSLFNTNSLENNIVRQHLLMLINRGQFHKRKQGKIASNKFIRMLTTVSTLYIR